MKKIITIIVLVLISFLILKLYDFIYQTSSDNQQNVTNFKNEKTVQYINISNQISNKLLSKENIVYIILCFTIQIFISIIAIIWIFSIKNHKSNSPKFKLELLDNIETYIDLPIYLGLFGTIIGFTLNTIKPFIGNFIAYLSTILGIIFTIIIRIFFYIPLKNALLKELYNES